MFDYESKLIFKCISGSHAYGFSTPESDIDYRGVLIPPNEYLLGIKNFEQYESKVPDLVYYDIRKFISLASNCNPNIIELLFMPDDVVQFTTPVWQKIIENRDLFVTQKARDTFSGYAKSQLNRIKLSKSYLMNPPKKQPEHSDFGLPDKVPVEQWKNLLAPHKMQPQEVMGQYFEAYQKYEQAKRYWEQYQNWKKNRNPKRAALEEKYQIDTKHASHLIRLFRMGKEILEGKGVIVRRPDAEELLAVRNGLYTYEQIVEMFEAADKEIKEMSSSLPLKPDMDKIDSLLFDILQDSFYSGVTK